MVGDCHADVARIHLREVQTVPGSRGHSRIRAPGKREDVPSANRSIRRSVGRSVPTQQAGDASDQVGTWTADGMPCVWKDAINSHNGSRFREMNFRLAKTLSRRRGRTAATPAQTGFFSALQIQPSATRLVNHQRIECASMRSPIAVFAVM